MKKKLAKVEDWYMARDDHGDTILEQCFDELNYFNSIYIPVKIPTSTGMPVDWAWTKIGYDTYDIALMYRRFYGQNYWVEPLIDTDYYAVSIRNMQQRIQSVYLANLAKYAKLIELGGYTYDPIANVDANEEFTYLSADGSLTTTLEKDIKQRQDSEGGSVTNAQTATQAGTDLNKTTTTRKVTPYDTSTPKKADETETKTDYNNVETFNKTYTIGAHKDVDTNTTTHGAVREGITAVDAFGNTIGDMDKYYTEKRVKHGNIGVTMTQQLIEEQRKILNYSIIKEFFNDINEQILVGIY